MKKFLRAMCSAALLAALCVPLTACDEPDPNAYYDPYLYFESSGMDKMMSTAIPSDDSGGCWLTAKSNVKITKITGIAYYNYGWLGSEEQYTIRVRYDDTITTDMFVENVTFDWREPFSFNFEATPESVANATSNYADFPATWKKGDEYRIATLPYNCGEFVVRNLNIEFVPA